MQIAELIANPEAIKNLSEQLNIANSNIDIALVRAFPIVKQFYRAGSSVIGGFTITADGGGVIFYPMLGVAKLHFTIHPSSTGTTYVQEGTCIGNAEHPSIQNYGTGRLQYQVFTTTGDHEITLSDFEPKCMFISGQPKTKIYKIWCEMVV